MSTIFFKYRTDCSFNIAGNERAFVILKFVKKLLHLFSKYCVFQQQYLHD